MFRQTLGLWGVVALTFVPVLLAGCGSPPGGYLNSATPGSVKYFVLIQSSDFRSSSHPAFVLSEKSFFFR